MDRPPPSSALEIMLLGGFQVRQNGHPVAGISYGKMRALLAYLAMDRRREHRRESLAALLWPRNDPETARGNLRRTLADLRRALESPSGEPIFSADKHSVGLICRRHVDTAALTAELPPCTPEDTAACDACLTQMSHRTELYRGEFMAGFALPDCPEFEDWLAVQRESMHRHALALLEKLSDCHESMGNYRRAIQFALRHTELEPWNEAAHCRVMRLYTQDNQRGAALAQYETCCRHLSVGLGTSPGEGTRRLAERIRSGALPQGSSREPLRDRPGPAVQNPSARTNRRTAEQGSGADRRQVTVLSCELSLSAHDDNPDKAMELLRACRDRCTEILQLHSGHVIPAHDGGLLAYFGYPRANEHAARHAVQAALAIARETAPGIEVRAGVHTGLIIASSVPSMPDTTGLTTKAAIQLRGEVGFREVAISGETCRIASGHFDCVSLGNRSLPGQSCPVEVFRVARKNDTPRLDAAAQLTPFTGRKAEIAQLLAAWKETSKGKRNIVLVQGEPGIGKSRLLLALKKRLPNKPHTIRELRCFPEFSQSPFHPLIAMLEGVFGFTQDDTPERKSARLVRHLETHFPSAAPDAIPLLSQLLSLPLDAGRQVPQLTPQKQKSQTMEILLEILQMLASRHPVLLIIEDLHWIDPSTLELLSIFITKETGTPVFVLLTARPEFDPPWDESLDTTMLLKPLSDAETSEMIAALGKDIPEPTLHSIADRSDGVPLFIEEMTKIATLGDRADIPITLHDLLAARIDAMGEAKPIAQIAATIGREFSLDLLRKIYADDPASLSYGLNLLQDADLIRVMNETACQFKHALIQEAAYQSQSRLDRQDAHRLIAEAIQDDFPDIAANQPEIVAQHLSSAGETWRAIEFWVKAGQRAAGHCANLEAAGQFNAALQLLATLPESQDRDRTEFRVLTSLCPVLYAAKGYGSTEATQANTRLSVLGESIGDSPELFLAKWALVMNTIAGVGSRDVPDAARSLLDMAHEDPLRKQAGHYAIANAAFWLGEFETTRDHAEQALALYHPDQSRQLQEQFGEDISVACAAYLSWALHFLGHPERARDACMQMLEQARKIDHPHTLALALCFASVLHRWLDMPEKTLPLSAETIAVSAQHGFSVWLAAGKMTHGWAQVMHGQPEGLAELRDSIAGMREAIGGISVVFLSALAEAYAHLGMHDEALKVLAEAQADEERTGDGHYTAGLRRLRERCLHPRAATESVQIRLKGRNRPVARPARGRKTSPP